MSEIEKTVKIIPFTKKSIWRIWSKQFLARAHFKGQKNLLLGKEVVATDDEVLDENFDSTTNEGQEVLQLRKLNELAYKDLILSFSDVVNFGLVEDACNDKFAEGDAAKAWKNLEHYHNPSTTANKVHLKAQFNTSRLTNGNKDPEVWISDLEVIRRKFINMKVQITEEDMMMHVINHLPKEYDAICDQLETELNSTNGYKLDMIIIRERLRNKFNKLKRRTKDEEDDEKEGEEEKA